MSTASTRWSLFSMSILLLAAGWIGLTALITPTSTQGKIPAPREGFLAPDFALKTLDGQTVRLSQWIGNPVLVNFWASWCPPCKAEMPSIQRVWETYRSQGFTVMSINATSQDSQAAATAFAQDERLTFPILFDQDGTANRLYQVQALPSTFFIDRKGMIHQVVIGGPISEALLRSQIEQLLKETP